MSNKISSTDVSSCHTCQLGANYPMVKLVLTRTIHLVLLFKNLIDLFVAIGLSCFVATPQFQLALPGSLLLYLLTPRLWSCHGILRVLMNRMGSLSTISSILLQSTHIWGRPSSRTALWCLAIFHNSTHTTPISSLCQPLLLLLAHTVKPPLSQPLNLVRHYVLT